MVVTDVLCLLSTFFKILLLSFPIEEHQKNYTTNRDRLQGNNEYDIWDMGSLLCLDEESLAELAYEEYMMILDSISPKVGYYFSKIKYGGKR